MIWRAALVLTAVAGLGMLAAPAHAHTPAPGTPCAKGEIGKTYDRGAARLTCRSDGYGHQTWTPPSTCDEHPDRPKCNPSPAPSTSTSASAGTVARTDPKPQLPVTSSINAHLVIWSVILGVAAIIFGGGLILYALGRPGRHRRRMLA